MKNEIKDGWNWTIVNHKCETDECADCDIVGNDLSRKRLHARLSDSQETSELMKKVQEVVAKEMNKKNPVRKKIKSNE